MNEESRRVREGNSHDHESVEVLHAIQSGLEEARPLADGCPMGDTACAATDSFYTQKWRVLSSLFLSLFTVTFIVLVAIFMSPVAPVRVSSRAQGRESISMFLA